MACSIASAEIGRAPDWKAAPTMSMLDVCVEPNRVSVSSPGFRYTPRAEARLIASWMSAVAG